METTVDDRITVGEKGERASQQGCSMA